MKARNEQLAGGAFVLHVLIVAGLISCAKPPPPSFKATIKNPKGKVIATIDGTFTIPKSPVEQWGGPAVGGLVYLAEKLAPPVAAAALVK